MLAGTGKGLITLGILAISVADVGFLYLQQEDAYFSGVNIDLGWVAGYFLIGLAALFRSRVPAHPQTKAAAKMDPTSESLMPPFGRARAVVARNR